MKFLCLCYYDIEALARLSPSEQQEVGKACAPYDAALRATGKLIAQASLSDPSSWSHFIPKNGKPTLAPGPYIKSNRQAGAFFIVEADSVEEHKALPQSMLRQTMVSILASLWKYANARFSSPMKEANQKAALNLQVRHPRFTNPALLDREKGHATFFIKAKGVKTFSKPSGPARMS